MTGALYRDAPFTFDRFDVMFGFVVTTDPASVTYGPGDGMTFAWISSAAAPALGEGGGGLAVRGLTGWAVSVDTYQNAEFTDAVTPNISLKNTLDMTNVASTAVTPALIDGNQHVARVRLVAGAVTVTLDGIEVLGAVPLPGYTAFSGYFGFGAGTGGAFEEHELTAVTARIGTTGPCAVQ